MNTKVLAFTLYPLSPFFSADGPLVRGGKLHTFLKTRIDCFNMYTEA